MKIGIDFYYASLNKRGMSRFVKNTVNAVNATRIFSKNIKFIPFIFWEQFFLPFFVWKSKVNLMIYPYNTSPFFLTSKKNIIVIHDIIFFNYLTNPKTFFSKYFFSSFYRYLILKALIKKYDAILTVSNYSKKMIETVFNIDGSKITVIENTLPTKFEKASLLTKKNKINNNVLFVSGDAPSKNLDFAIHGIDDFCCEFNFIISVNIVGISKNKFNALKNKTKNLELFFFSDIGDMQLIQLYKSADCLIVPSFEEGFSIPIIEALANDTPVIASNKTCIPEILGDIGFYFDPECKISFKDSLSKFYFNKVNINSNLYRNRYIENYSTKIIKKKWLQFIDKLF